MVPVIYILVVLLNTFLCCSSFHQSARWLDRRRLGKQRVEAQQVLHLVTALEYLGSKSVYNDPLPKNTGVRYDWVRRIAKRFKDDPVKAKYKHPMTGNPISLGFVYHPIVLMWLGYSDALKVYITAHIDEWTARGYKNTMKRYDVVASKRPKWCKRKDIHLRHRSQLLYKEIDRQEPPWYILKSKFKDLERMEYDWVYQ